MEERKLEYRETADFKVIENTLLLVGKLSDTRDKVKAMEILRDAFAKELGAMADKWVYDEPKPDVYVKFVNPKDEGFLYPHLAVLLKEAVLKKCRQDRKERVLSYIDAFMDLWKEGRSNQASQEQQKRPQEATNGHTPTITPQEQKTAAEPKELKDLLPDELNTDEAVKVFQRAIDRGLIEKAVTGLKWNDTKQLLSYFADRMSNKFNLSSKLDKDENVTTNWKIFEPLFACSNLRMAKQNWMRLNTKFEPTGFEKVDALF